VVFVDALPVNASNKVDKKVLRARLAAVGPA
jgi:acyl-coenzyme A synthetase/AMP-(fatty) acid ligase